MSRAPSRLPVVTAIFNAIDGGAGVSPTAHDPNRFAVGTDVRCGHGEGWRPSKLRGIVVEVHGQERRVRDERGILTWWHVDTLVKA